MVSMRKAIKGPILPKSTGGPRPKRVSTSRRVVPKAQQPGSKRKSYGIPSAKRIRGKPTRNVTGSMKRIGRRKFT